MNKKTLLLNLARVGAHVGVSLLPAGGAIKTVRGSDPANEKAFAALAETVDLLAKAIVQMDARLSKLEALQKVK